MEYWLVLDVYWHFGSVDNHYLGRILADLDPNKEVFSILPPHWTILNPLGYEKVKHAMEIKFGEILVNHEYVVPILVRSLACIVHHSNGLIEKMVHCPAHDFTKSTILHDRVLLEKLKAFVTTELTEGVICQATEIPPYIGLATQLKDIADKMSVMMESFQCQTSTIVSAINYAIDKKAWDSGHVTGEGLEKISSNFSKDFKEESIKAMNEQLNNLRNELGGAVIAQRTTKYMEKERTADMMTTQQKMCTHLVDASMQYQRHSNFFRKQL